MEKRVEKYIEARRAAGTLGNRMLRSGDFRDRTASSAKVKHVDEITDQRKIMTLRTTSIGKEPTKMHQ